MKAISSLIVAAAVLSAAGLAQAFEISEVPEVATSTMSRESVRAQALAANQAKQLRHDFTGPAVMPMSSRSRDEVRREAWARTTQPEDVALDRVGGM